MFKRWMLFAVLVSVIICGAFSAQASGLSKAERYEAARVELEKYLCGEESMPLENLCETLESLGGTYRKSWCLNLYACCLHDLEQDEYGSIFIRIYQMRMDTEFMELLEEWGWGSLDELEKYALGRQAELEGDTEKAVVYYMQSASMLDSMMRITQLQGAVFFNKYEEAGEWYRIGTRTGYEKACKLYEELAAVNFRDSRDRLEEARARLEAMATKAPTATPKPTAAPTAKPTNTPKPTAKPTNTPKPTQRPTATPTPSYYSYLPDVPYGGITPNSDNTRSIMWVQQCLRSCGYGQLAVDGNWNERTTQAVREFKRDYGLSGSATVVTYADVCRMLDVFYQKDMPLRYLRHYVAN